MLSELGKETTERPFEGLKIYYSGSIKGAPELDPNFAWHLVRYMVEGGANVLSEHVAARNPQEMEEIRARKTGMNTEDFKNMPREIFLRDIVRKQDVKWVDEATHFVSLVNAPSHGVGMEIERAILKPERGLNMTPVLCLVHENLFEKLSGMVRGVSKEEHPAFYVKTYKDLEEAKRLVSDFLKGRLS